MKIRGALFVVVLCTGSLLYASAPAPVAVRQLGFLSTEQSHPITKDLSTVMAKDIVAGLRLLHEVDRGVIEGFNKFVADYYDMMFTSYSRAVLGGHKCYLVGSGSSGRVGIDLAAKNKHVSVIDVMAGGDSALIRAREGFEDSEKDGADAIAAHGVGSEDMVILISASGSAFFNVGAGKAARAAGATVYSFCNSERVPEATGQLFTEHGVIPVTIDIGAQAITGSTRLQAATVAELCLGVLVLGLDPEEVRKQLEPGCQVIADNLSGIAAVVQAEAAIFSAPESNFRQVADETEAGYTTLLGGSNCIRSVVIDAVETAPTFSTNPPRRKTEVGKRAEFQTFLIAGVEERQAWHLLLGREINPACIKDVEEFLIAQAGLALRPTGAGNVVIGVAYDTYHHLLPTLRDAQARGARTVLIVLSGGCIDHTDAEAIDHKVFLEHMPTDDYGLIQTVMLKQVLNMISTGSMVLMEKVDGNSMIDTNASNNKLIDRASRLVEERFVRRGLVCPMEKSAIDSLVQEIRTNKKDYEARGLYTPSPVKIATTMIQRSVDFDAAVGLLSGCKEKLDVIFSV